MSGEDERHDEHIMTDTERFAGFLYQQGTGGLRPFTDQMTAQKAAALDHHQLRAHLAVAWGWMIAKGADETALRAVGYPERLSGQPQVERKDWGQDWGRRE